MGKSITTPKYLLHWFVSLKKIFVFVYPLSILEEMF